MRVFATFILLAADLIDGTLDAVRRQTRPPDGILIGATALRPSPG
jgi:hypothetical protein